jgi:hypothetical protein
MFKKIGRFFWNVAKATLPVTVAIAIVGILTVVLVVVQALQHDWLAAIIALVVGLVVTGVLEVIGVVLFFKNSGSILESGIDAAGSIAEGVFGQLDKRTKQPGGPTPNHFSTWGSGSDPHANRPEGARSPLDI